MSALKLHEKIKSILHNIIVHYAIHIGNNPDACGSATIGERSKDAGKEPDDSFWFDRVADGNDPDLVVEVVVTSEAISKQSFYARFGVAELWIWEDSRLSVYLLEQEGSNFRVEKQSMNFPDLDMKLVEKCCLAKTLGEGLQEFRQSLS